jgi:putative tryptophan/tyrosine transport system substrate-binding protein
MLSSNRWGHMQINHLGRRKFIALLGGAAVPWPLAAGAQQPSMPVIGFLNPRSLRSDSRLVTAFHQGLGETGYVQGKNVAIEYRWAEGHNDRLPALTADLVRRQVAVIVATGGNVSALAAQAVSTTIPIVFTLGGDPIMLGLVTSLSRPGGNITGISALTGLLGAKRLELLHELVPKATMIGIVMNPTNPIAEAYARDLQGAARTRWQQIHIQNASSEGEIDTAFASLVELRAGAILIVTDAFFIGRRDQLVALAARYAIPTIYENRDFAAAGGLISYGTDLADMYRQAGVYAGRILKGEKPADLPVMLPTKFELVINAKTAKALGLEIPPMLLALADEVIE